MRRTPALPAVLALSFAAAACAVPAAPPTASPTPPSGAREPATEAPARDGSVGVLVMAHGGSPEWNASVDAAVAPLSADVPTAVAYGMANPHTLAPALDALRKQGVDRVAVVRLFLSGESFLDQTRYLLGMSDTPPATFVLMGPAAADPEARRPIRHDLALATHDDGILGSPEATEVMVDRARTVSVRPATESVLLLAHGMGDEAENRRVLDAMERVADRVADAGFAEVEVETLREDWEQERVDAERRIRGWVERQDEEGRRAIVLPMRLSGFGPYAEVLAGLSYTAGEGLLPHEAIGRWIRATADRVSCGNGWGAVADACPAVVVDEQERPVGR